MGKRFAYSKNILMGFLNNSIASDLINVFVTNLNLAIPTGRGCGVEFSDWIDFFFCLESDRSTWSSSDNVGNNLLIVNNR